MRIHNTNQPIISSFDEINYKVGYESALNNWVLAKPEEMSARFLLSRQLLDANNSVMQEINGQGMITKIPPLIGTETLAIENFLEDTEVTIPLGTNYLSIRNCDNLTEVFLPERDLVEVTIIGAKIKSLWLPDGIEEVDLSCCYDLNDLPRIPDSLRKITLPREKSELGEQIKQDYPDIKVILEVGGYYIIIELDNDPNTPSTNYSDNGVEEESPTHDNGEYINPFMAHFPDINYSGHAMEEELQGPDTPSTNYSDNDMEEELPRH